MKYSESKNEHDTLPEERERIVRWSSRHVYFMLEAQGDSLHWGRPLPYLQSNDPGRAPPFYWLLNSPHADSRWEHNFDYDRESIMRPPLFTSRCPPVKRRFPDPEGNTIVQHVMHFGKFEKGGGSIETRDGGIELLDSIVTVPGSFQNGREIVRWLCTPHRFYEELKFHRHAAGDWVTERNAIIAQLPDNVPMLANREIMTFAAWMLKKIGKQKLFRYVLAAAAAADQKTAHPYILSFSYDDFSAMYDIPISNSDVTIPVNFPTAVLFACLELLPPELAKKLYFLTAGGNLRDCSRIAAVIGKPLLVLVANDRPVRINISGVFNNSDSTFYAADDASLIASFRSTNSGRLVESRFNELAAQLEKASSMDARVILAEADYGKSRSVAPAPSGIERARKTAATAAMAAAAVESKTPQKSMLSIDSMDGTQLHHGYSTFEDTAIPYEIQIGHPFGFVHATIEAAGSRETPQNGLLYVGDASCMTIGLINSGSSDDVAGVLKNSLVNNKSLEAALQSIGTHQTPPDVILVRLERADVPDKVKVTVAWTGNAGFVTTAIGDGKLNANASKPQNSARGCKTFELGQNDIISLYTFDSSGILSQNNQNSIAQLAGKNLYVHIASELRRQLQKADQPEQFSFATIDALMKK